MRSTRTLRALAAMMLLLGSAAVAQAQAPAAAPTGLVADLLKDINDLEVKFTGLAQVMSPAQYTWRPAPIVRSPGEVLLHVASDNYFLPAVLGTPAPAATKINATDFAAVTAFEKQGLNREATVEALVASFAHLKQAFSAMPESRMNEKITVFGQEFTVRGFMILTTSHLHEHLGQMIAYARVNGVTPPWSQN